MYLLSPYWNRLLINLSRNEFLSMLIIMIILWSVIRTLTTFDMYGSQIPLFMMCYSLGAYWRLHGKTNIRRARFVYGICCLLIWLVMKSSYVVFWFLGHKYTIFAQHLSFLGDRNSIFTISLAFFSLTFVSIFKGFISIYINELSACMFGVFLIHEHHCMKRIL